MIINVHAGHNPDGKVGCGAVGLIKESTEARKVKDEVIKILKTNGHTVYDCTVDDGTSQSDVLKKIVKKCNQHKADIDISIHFNSGANDKKGNGKSCGTEVLIYSDSSKAKPTAEKILKNICSLGYKNRGIKIRNDLYVLKNTKAPALLIECCFVDDKDDIKLYEPQKMAKTIADAFGVIETKPSNSNEFKVKINTNSLNVRNGCGTQYKVNTTVKKGEVYTIVQTAGNWGRLKSGAGWINLSYTVRV